MASALPSRKRPATDEPAGAPDVKARDRSVPFPALRILAREVLLLSKSRREALQDLMKDTTMHVVGVKYDDDQEQQHWSFTELVLWNPLELRWDDVSTRRCTHFTQFQNALMARGYQKCEDNGQRYTTQVPTAAMQAQYF
eukprot:g3495.t1